MNLEKNEIKNAVSCFILAVGLAIGYPSIRGIGNLDQQIITAVIAVLLTCGTCYAANALIDNFYTKSR